MEVHGGGVLEGEGGRDGDREGGTEIGREGRKMTMKENI